MQKTKCYLAALVSGVLLVTGIWLDMDNIKKTITLPCICGKIV